MGLAIVSGAAWGTSLRFAANFCGRWGLVSSARQLISELCATYLEPNERSAALVMAVQELVENLAKYSLGSASFEFELGLRDGEPEARICTHNLAAEESLAQVGQLLECIVTSAEPVALYDEWVASSGERDGSRLGLIRLRAEAGLTLSYSIDATGLTLAVSGPVEPIATVS